MPLFTLTRAMLRSACLAVVLVGSAATAQTAPAHPVDAFWSDWLTFWNGDLDLADEVVAEGIVLHATLLDGRASATINDPETFAEWVGGLRQAIPDLEFETVVGPISEPVGPADGTIIAGHWRASGTYAGGFPGATAEAGTPVAFAGTDIVRMKDGVVVEYWLVSDTLTLLSQLGVGG